MRNILIFLFSGQLFLQLESLKKLANFLDFSLNLGILFRNCSLHPEIYLKIGLVEIETFVLSDSCTIFVF